MNRCGVGLSRIAPRARCLAGVSKQNINNKGFSWLRCLTSSRDITSDTDSHTRGRSSYQHTRRNAALLGAFTAAGVSLYTIWKNGCARMDAAPETSKTKAKKLSPVKTQPEDHGKAAPPYPDLDSQPGIPGHAQYLIIGGGTAGFSASTVIRARDPTAKVLIITDEEYMPYMRPQLSKELWFEDDPKLARKFKYKNWEGKVRSIFRQKGIFVNPKKLPYMKNGGISVVTGRKVVKLDPHNEKVILDNGWEVMYDKCLIATGGEPRNLPVIQRAGEEVMKRTSLFRKAADFKKLNRDVEKMKSIAVIGGGFLGSELAVALANKGRAKGLKVNQVFPEEGVLGVVLPEYLSKWTTEHVKQEGVSVIAKKFVTGAAYEDGKVQLTLNTGDKLSVDHVLVAVGIEPNVELAKSGGLEVDEAYGGYRVNSELQAKTNVWVAGDVCSFYDPKLGRRRVEHHDHAVVSGRLAGENMTGAARPYWHQSMFWSSLGMEVELEAIGQVDSRLPTVAVFAQPETQEDSAGKEGTPKELNTVEQSTENRSEKTQPASSETSSEDYSRGVVFYMKDDIVVGVVTVNMSGFMSTARKILGHEHKDLEEVAKWFGLYWNPDDEINGDDENTENMEEFS